MIKVQASNCFAKTVQIDKYGLPQFTCCGYRGHHYWYYPFSYELKKGVYYCKTSGFRNDAVDNSKQFFSSTFAGMNICASRNL